MAVESQSLDLRCTIPSPVHGQSDSPGGLVVAARLRRRPLGGCHLGCASDQSAADAHRLAHPGVHASQRDIGRFDWPRLCGNLVEKDHIITEGFFNSHNTNYIGMLNGLGPSLLRLGGSSTDELVWTQDGPGGTAGQVAPADVTRFAGFIKALGWQCLYGVNLAGIASGTTTAALAAAEVAYVAQQLGSSLYGIEIGNEPDQYDHSYFPTGWSLTEYETLWESFRTEILATTPGVAITGPTAGRHVADWTVPFGDYAAKQLSLLTQHYYRSSPIGATTAGLIAPDPTLVNDYLAPLQTCSQAIGVPYRISECNSYDTGGATGVSNTFASALWAIDFLFDCALGGAVGTNFTRTAPGGSTPIDDNNGVVTGAAPEYYGILLFTLAGQGSLYQTAVSAGSLNVTGYAVQTSSGLNLVVVNKDPTENLQLTIHIPQAVTTATLMEMTQLTTGAAGPDLSATSGVAIQGSTVGIDGAFSPGTAYTLTATGSQISCYVPALSAVLIQIA
jgi:hypothetical protein